MTIRIGVSEGIIYDSAGGFVVRYSAFAAAAAALFATGVQAQTAAPKFFARSTLKTGAAPTTAATPNTLSCSGPMTPYTAPYPYEAVEGPIATVQSHAEGLQTCNDFGKKYGAALKTFNVCYVAPAYGTSYYAYLYRATVYNYGTANTAAAGHATATCRYNP